MPIPESQIETWAARSQTQTAVNAHQRIRDRLRSAITPLPSFDDYLQGSYRNYTNTVNDHDVDVVIELEGSFFFSDWLLPEPQRTQLRSAIQPATHDLATFRAKVLRELIDEFGASNVTNGNKVINVKGQPGVRMDADVLVCEEFREYVRFNGDLNQGYVEGIKFWDYGAHRWVINYPDAHYRNGVEKNENTGERFKPLVRIWKNARRYMVDHRLLPAECAPSYFLQGLLYNVPDAQYQGSYYLSFLGALVWLMGAMDHADSLYCQNGLIKLFGDTPEQWREAQARQFLMALAHLDQGWVH